VFESVIPVNLPIACQRLTKPVFKPGMYRRSAAGRDTPVVLVGALFNRKIKNALSPNLSTLKQHKKTKAKKYSQLSDFSAALVSTSFFSALVLAYDKDVKKNQKIFPPVSG
jgi:hypothetical protein